MDFKKGFDAVDHSILIFELYIMGMLGLILKWIESFLSGRKNIVKTNVHSFVLYKASSGVPRGFHLRLLLFILFIKVVASGLKYANMYINLC